ncbi:apolipoprotein N-acyltransferase [Corynebacterium tapiri]|uniref:Apolipoprotein N-acyltransferase n=1 Tax=Corynebacterium tapiri TaxID=1448266 RepID=A0A5C4U3E6_9CORY|nr:apolipoprotein N-acyltransferase [Corynebacterium tapiri]TNL97624.1 apolipoprotein N-acyltransferase [Corynebacterium tapiri]
MIALQLALAALSGWLTYLSYEPHGLWPAGIIGVGLLYFLLVWRRPSLRLGALLGFVHAVTMYLFTLPWIGELVGRFPYVALAISCAIYALLTGLGGTAIGRWRYGFVLFPFLYVAVEHLRSSFPFGGFAWLRLAWGQIDGPLAPLAALGGPVLVSFSAALAGCALVAVLCKPRKAGGIALVLCLVAGVASGVFHRSMAEETAGEATVAAIQGNVPRLGLDFNAQRRAVLNNHARVTHQLAQAGAQPDLVIWPENSSDVNPFADDQARTTIESAVQDIGAPVLVGTLTEDEVGERNTMQVFDPETGAGDFHHKKYLQPFGEYMPMRDFFRMFSSYVDLAGDFKPGTGNSTVLMDGIRVGVATCYEVIVDDSYRTAVENGAQILATPTNNATFGFSDMTYQQLAMSRLRAIELDRAVVVAATSGVSAIVHPDGSVSQQTGIFEPGSLVETLPLKSTVTPAVHFGQLLEWGLTIMGALTAFIALVANRKRIKD